MTIVEAAGGQALPFVVDIRNNDQVQACIEEAVKVLGALTSSSTMPLPSGSIR